MSPTTSHELDGASLDVAIIGAGFAGLAALHRFRSDGFHARVFEAGDGVGGTWYWNRYPGARCDVPSMEYSYSFSAELEQDWTWSERYSPQPEILRYLNHVADRFDLRRDIELGTRIGRAVYDEGSASWTLTTSRDEQVHASFLVLAVGNLSSPRLPDIPGVTTFSRSTYHTGQWPAEPVTFAGQRVGVIGTGSSATQLIPIVAEECDSLVVFQRTPNWTMPAWNAPLDPDTVRDVKAHYPELRERARTSRLGTAASFGDSRALDVSDDDRSAEYERRWRIGGNQIQQAFTDIGTSDEANRTLRMFLSAKIRGTVDDPETARKLDPGELPFGSRRGSVGSGYYEAFNRDNVDLVDVRDTPILEITDDGVRTSAKHFEFDALVFATGYDAMTGSITAIDVRGTGGAALRERWAAGPQTYLGVAVSGFPNMFMVTGPGSPSVLSNVVVSIEQHVDWIATLLCAIRDTGSRSVEANADAEAAWGDHVQEVAGGTLMLRGNSWYMGANVPGKPRVFMPYVGGVGRYRELCEDIAKDSYRGFDFDPT